MSMSMSQYEKKKLQSIHFSVAARYVKVAYEPRKADFKLEKVATESGKTAEPVKVGASQKKSSLRQKKIIYGPSEVGAKSKKFAAESD